MTNMIDVPCIDCSSLVEITIDEEDRIEGGCFTGVISPDEEDILDDRIIVTEYVDEEPREGTEFVIYTECEDCCPRCSD